MKRFTRSNKHVNNGITKKVPKATVESRFQELVKAWNELQNKHEKYIIAEATMEEDDTYLDAPMAELEETELAKDDYIQSIEQQQTADSLNNSKQTRANNLKKKEAQLEIRKTKFLEACTSINNATQDTEKTEHVVDAMKEAVERMQTSKKEIEQLHEDIVALTIEDGEDASTVQHEWITQYEKQFSELMSTSAIMISKYSKQTEGKFVHQKLSSLVSTEIYVSMHHSKRTF